MSSIIRGDDGLDTADALVKETTSKYCSVDNKDTFAIIDEVGISSAVDEGLGRITFNFDQPFDDTNYHTICSCSNTAATTAGGMACRATDLDTVSSVYVKIISTAITPAAKDTDFNTIIIYSS